MTGVSVRPATNSDVEAIQRVGLLTWPPAYLPISNASYVLANLQAWWTAESVRESIVSYTTLVAEDDGAVVGTTTLGEFEGDSVVWKIYVLPDRQGTGVGQALMDAALKSVSADRDVLIEFVEGNERARAFYEKNGFRHERSEPGEHGTTTIWYRLQR